MVNSVSKKADAGLILVLITLFFLCVFSYKSKSRLTENSQAISETNLVLLELKATLSTMQEAEAGVNSFLLAEDPEFLELYKTKSKAMGVHLQTLANFAADNEVQQNNLTKLHKLVSEKTKQLNYIVQFRHSKEYTREKLEPYVTQGALIMTDIRSLINETEDQARTLLAKHVKEANRVAEISHFAILFSCALAFLFLFTSRLILRKEINERRKTEEAFQKMRLALENAVEGISRIDEQGTFLSVNKAFASLLGFEIHELIGRNWINIIDEHSQEEVIEQYARVKEDGRSEVEALCRPKSGEPFYVRLTMVLTHSDKGKFEGHYCFLKDISKEKREQKELIDARKAALEASLAKSDFLANMSHEIRTPMNGVIGMSGLLSKTNLNDKQKQFVDTIRISAEALLTLINDILDFSKIESRKMIFETIDFSLQDVLEDTEKMLIHSARAKSIFLNFEISSEVPQFLLGDPGKFRQILINLIGNAVKFTKEGGVTVSVTKQSENQKNCEIRVEIQDTGIGLNNTALNRLFQPFTQADSSTTRQFGGTGLGLAICKRLVEMMGGEIGVQSEEGKGSAFWFTVKMGQGKEPLREPKKTELVSQLSKEQKRNLNLLVVEDNQVNQRVVIEMLSQLGFTVEAAENGKTALEIYKHRKIDLIFMDCQMSVMDGYEATKEIRDFEKLTAKRTPIVALTANVTAQDKQKCFDAGMDDYLNKPVDMENLAGTIERWLAPAPSIPSAPVVTADANALIDWSAVEKLLHIKADGSFFTELLTIYNEKFPDYMTAIEDAVKNGDAAALREAAHALKGSSLNLGLLALGEISRKLEESSENAAQIISDLKVCYIKTKDELTHQLENKAA